MVVVVEVVDGSVEMEVEISFSDIRRAWEGRGLWYLYGFQSEQEWEEPRAKT